MPKKYQKIKFKQMASMPKDALVLFFDLQGFSKFFSQPDVQGYVTVFLNNIFECFSIIFEGGDEYWVFGKKKYNPLMQPIHAKFVGDGALYIWTFDSKDILSKKKEIIYLVNRLWNLKNNFGKILSKCSDEVPVVDLPKKIRFGLAAGSVYKLTYEDSNKEEFIGYCINLASRLQAYCRDLGFIASARIGIPMSILKKHGYIKVVATKLKGFPKEIVIVDELEYKELEEKVRTELFEELS